MLSVRSRRRAYATPSVSAPPTRWRATSGGTGADTSSSASNKGGPPGKRPALYAKGSASACANAGTMSRGRACQRCGLSEVFAKERTMKRIVLLALVTAACGGSSGTAVDRNRAGTGSSTLLVSATVTVTNSATSPTTSLTADVSDGLGAAVTGATVTIQNAGLGGDTALVEGGTAGHYTATKTSLPAGDFTLSVVAVSLKKKS